MTIVVEAGIVLDEALERAAAILGLPDPNPMTIVNLSAHAMKVLIEAAVENDIERRR